MIGAGRKKSIKPGEPVLTEGILKRLAKLGVKIQEHFGRPQDIEWAMEAGKIFILQARPITTLPEPLPRMGRLTRTLIRTLAEIVPERPYPMDLEWIRALFSNAVGKVARYFGMGVPTIDEIFVIEDGIAVEVNPRFRVRPTLRILGAPLIALWLALKYKPLEWERGPLLNEYLHRIEAINSKDFENLDMGELKRDLKDLLSNLSLIGEIRKHYLPGIAFSYLKVRLMLKLARMDEHASTLLFTCVDTKVTEANRELEKLAQLVRSQPELRALFENHEPGEILKRLPEIPVGREFLKRFWRFLEKYGHREAAGSALISRGTWSENPEVVIGIIKGLSAAELGKNESCNRFQEVLDRVLSGSFLGRWPFRNSFLRSLENARQLHRLRENTRFYAMKTIPGVKRILKHVGERLSRGGALDSPEDVFYLTVDELDERIGELKKKVQRRKKRWDELKNRPFINPQLLLESTGKGEAVLRGLPGSPGIAEGTVKVITNPSEFHKLKQGDILVAPYTTPAWTPLFRLAAGVVVDTGGPLSHAAIVAREYGIPAVMGTGSATKVLRDGMRVRVDGTRGLVFLLEE